LRRAKAYLWQGSPHRALKTLEDLTWEIGIESDNANAMQDKLEEFMGYVTANLTSIPNYASRHRHGEPIATGFVESAVNRCVGLQREPTTCCKSGPECSISSCAAISSAGTRGSSPLPSRFTSQRSTRNGPLSGG
jgi:hypothetical protein